MSNELKLKNGVKMQDGRVMSDKEFEKMLDKISDKVEKEREEKQWNEFLKKSKEYFDSLNNEDYEPCEEQMKKLYEIEAYLKNVVIDDDIVTVSHLEPKLRCSGVEYRSYCAQFGKDFIDLLQKNADGIEIGVSNDGMAILDVGVNDTFKRKTE